MESAPQPPELSILQPSPEYAQAILACDILQSNGFEAVVVGGAVRDMMLGEEPKDYDLATSASPAQIVALPGFERSEYHDTAQAYGVSRVRLGDSEIEVASYRKDVEAHLGREATQVDLGATLEDDLERRDFTINAIALDPVTSQLFYQPQALSDLDSKTIRFVGDGSERIREDPLRIIRAVRFRNKLGFEYEAQTHLDIKQAVAQGELGSISGERLRIEITAILVSAQSRQKAIEDLDELGIIDKLLPELSAGKGVEQGVEFHAEGDVWVHQLLIMEALPRDASPELIWSALLHDIGKPSKQKLPEDSTGRITFHGHDVTSEELARPILNRLKFSNKQKDDILWLIEKHINIAQLPKMKPSNQKKMMNHPMFADLLELHRADGLASWRTMPDGTISKEKASFAEIEKIWQEHLSQPVEVRAPSVKRDLGISGQDIISLMPGFDKTQDSRLIGLVLSELEEQYANGIFGSRDEALQIARDSILAARPSTPSINLD
ncbi:MAG: CCA tRNA nucleotidyltransferase [Candidatus Saccharibacteria bacterium]